MEKMLVFGCKGSGSAIAEAFLELVNLPFDRREVDYDKPSPERDELLSYNPLCQVPTLVLPNGQVMTETLAIAHYIHQLAPYAGIIPKSQSTAKFLRWSTFLVSAIYPTFTYGDNPSKWVSSEEGAKSLRLSTDEHRKKLWGQVEAEAGSPYFLGDTFSAIDVYLAVMIHWRPREDWFQAHCPKIRSIADKTAKLPTLAKTWKTNFV